jgi:hypothetical protein
MRCAAFGTMVRAVEEELLLEALAFAAAMSDAVSSAAAAETTPCGAGGSIAPIFGLALPSRLNGGGALLEEESAGRREGVGSTERKMRLIAITPASFVSAMRSAPTYPTAAFAIAFQSIPISSFISRHITWRILARAASSGIPRLISRSNRPARLSAESIESGRLVAPITITILFGSPEPVEEEVERESMQVRS